MPMQLFTLYDGKKKKGLLFVFETTRRKGKKNEKKMKKK
jgi:hypothetical protein